MVTDRVNLRGIVQEAIRKMARNPTNRVEKTPRDGYIYILTEDGKNNDVFKVGRTNEPRRRLREYGGKWVALEFYMCSNDVEAEKALISEMKAHFPVAKGREYFKGDLSKALDIFARVCRDTPCPMELG